MSSPSALAFLSRSTILTWDQAQFSFHFVNNIPAGKAVAVTENVWEPLKLGLISGYIIPEEKWGLLVSSE